jgi:hypothetical protein
MSLDLPFSAIKVFPGTLFLITNSGVGGIAISAASLGTNQSGEPGIAIMAEADSGGTGIQGTSEGTSDSGSGCGVAGYSNAGVGVLGTSDSNWGVGGTSNSGAGVLGKAPLLASQATAPLAWCRPFSTNSIGLFATGTPAGYFSGDVQLPGMFP